MKKIILFGLICYFVSISTLAFAHPPQDIKVNFDKNSKMLRAVITHNVSNPKAHFIKKVDVSINGEEIIEHKISEQDNNTTQVVSYLIPDVKPGDKISVEAYCSISGKLEKQIKVE